MLKYHRTLGTTLTCLVDTGFEIRKVVEFAPSAEQIAAMPALEEELERPMMLLLHARRRD